MMVESLALGSAAAVGGVALAGLGLRALPTLVPDEVTIGGTYSEQLVLGDVIHVPHDPPLMSEQITITVVE